MRINPKFRRLLQTGLVLIFVYLGSYLGLSFGGTYAPGSMGAWGPKVYHWFPKGFAKNGKAGYRLIDFYCPLWALDMKFWHRSIQRKEDRGDYPLTDIYGWGPKE